MSRSANHVTLPALALVPWLVTACGPAEPPGMAADLNADLLAAAVQTHISAASLEPHARAIVEHERPVRRRRRKRGDRLHRGDAGDGRRPGGSAHLRDLRLRPGFGLGLGSGRTLFPRHHFFVFRLGSIPAGAAGGPGNAGGPAGHRSRHRRTHRPRGRGPGRRLLPESSRRLRGHRAGRRPAEKHPGHRARPAGCRGRDLRQHRGARQRPHRDLHLGHAVAAQLPPPA